MFKEFHIENFENSSKVLEELLNNSRVEVEKLLEIKNKKTLNFINFATQPVEHYC
mgnify:CR=1 FL=1